MQCILYSITMDIFKCPKGCCTIKISEYNSTTSQHNQHNEQIPRSPNNTYSRKAGVFIYDPKTDRVLLVQSRGNLWGSPKGTIKANESEIDCAIREVKEETGLQISSSNFKKYTMIRNNATYFYMEMEECDVNIQNHIPKNDANGIGWIKTNCIQELIEQGNIVLSKHCQLIFKIFRNKNFPVSTFSTLPVKK